MAPASSKLHAILSFPTASETPDIFFVALYNNHPSKPRVPNFFQPLRFLTYYDRDDPEEQLQRRNTHIQNKYHVLRPLFQQAHEDDVRRARDELESQQQQQQQQSVGGLQPIQEEDETDNGDAQNQDDDDGDAQDYDFVIVDQAASSSSSEETSDHSNDTESVTMVQLTEVPDEHFENPQVGPEIEEDVDDDYSDTDSEISVESEYDPSAESLSERLSALRDIIPPTTRSWVSSKVAATVGFGRASAWFAGKAVWVVTSTALLIGVPYAICVTEEQQVVAMEQEYKMREVGSEVLTAEGGNTADRVGAALGGGDVKATL